MNMECKFCHKDKKLIDAHIIPRCFFEAMRDKGDNRPFELLSNTKNEHPRKLWIGSYDKNILCEGCEKVFQKYDDYACKILLSNTGNNSEHILDSNEKKVACKLKNVDCKKLKLFFLSVLWRASVSKRKEFKRVEIGPFENNLRDMIQKDNPGGNNDFLVIVRKFVDILGKNFLMDPYIFKVDGINFYRFYLGAGYEFHIKVDKRNIKESDALCTLALKSESPLYITFRDNLSSSKEFPILKDILNKSNQKRNNLK